MNPVLAFTCTHGSRRFMPRLAKSLRDNAGCDFDWLVVESGVDQEQRDAILSLRDAGAVQFVRGWPENRGQHWAMREAVELANGAGYEHLLRVDDDILIASRDILRTMLDRLQKMVELADDGKCHFVAAPRVIGLRRPLKPQAQIYEETRFPCELMPVLGGAFRLHPMWLLRSYQPDIYAPVRRRDPENLGIHITRNGGLFIRFPDLRVIHNTDQLEAMDSPEEAHIRRMNTGWCWLGEGA